MNRPSPIYFIFGGIALLGAGCSTYDVVSIASSGDPRYALAHYAERKAASYERNPLQAVQDIKRVERNYRKLIAYLSGEVEPVWGKGEVVVPNNKRYVKYTENYRSRAIVEFDSGRITVETVAEENPQSSLKNAVVTTLLTPDDPRSVDLYSAKTIELTGRPYLYGLVDDQNGHDINSPARAEAYADYLIGQRLQVRKAGNKTVHAVQFHMVNDFENRQAKRYANYVERYTREYGVSKSLVYAVIKTESAFNPYAVSAAPAYGLMQLVPSAGGRDAYRYAKGHDATPSSDYLFDAGNNIELGTAYLDLIERNYLKGIHDPVSLEYCTIAAYNGGAGNVLRLFHADRSQALDVINRLSPSEVYRKLRFNHPRDETRRYLGKVLEARREFVNI